MIPTLITIVEAYLLGSIPFGYLLVRSFKHQDVRTTGSGNIGATNVARSGGKELGIATLLLDAGKGWLAVVLTHSIVKAFSLGAPNTAMNLAAIAALCAVLGHMFPIWLGFRGGKGVATALGVFLALSWPSALAALAVFAAVTFFTRYVSLGSVIGAATLPIFVWLLTPNRDLLFMLCTIAISVLVILKHSGNLQRLRAGKEAKFGSAEPRTAAL